MFTLIRGYFLLVGSSINKPWIDSRLIFIVLTMSGSFFLRFGTNGTFLMKKVPGPTTGIKFLKRLWQVAVMFFH